MKTLQIIFCFLLTLVAGRAATNDLPKLDEVLKLLRSNLSGLTEAELDRAVVRGLLNELRPQISLTSGSETNGISSTNSFRALIYENAFGYFRIGAVEDGLSGKLAENFKQLSKTNKLKGLIIDLRFTEGNNYSEAARTADQFLGSAQPLLNWGSGSAAATAKTNEIDLPVAILVNKFTSGAAEALAAVLRETKVGLLIGSTTAGQANVYKEFPLENGQRLRVATAQIKVGKNKLLEEELQPDIEVVASADDEKIYLEDAYKSISKPIAPGQVSLETTSTNAAETNRPRSRLNERELVRLRREGLSPDSEFVEGEARSIKGAEAALRLINDPALARAVDLLKGLAVVRQVRSR